MNQILIEGLATHADFYVGNEHSDKSYEERDRLWVEKYTRLVVQECADVGERYANGNYEVYNQIMKHFGVEE